MQSQKHVFGLFFDSKTPLSELILNKKNMSGDDTEVSFESTLSDLSSGEDDTHDVNEPNVDLIHMKTEDINDLSMHKT